MERARVTLYTIGHGTRALQELIEALRSAGVESVADVRAYPRSKTNPQFNADTISGDLGKAGVGYEHWKSLGGRRRGLGAASPNTAWKHPAFRGFADYMMEETFWTALDSLLTAAASSVTALMCSETLWWRCHRRMIADAAVARGTKVLHIMKQDVLVPHVLSPPARIVGDRVSYI